MPQVNINSNNDYEAEIKQETLQHLADNLTLEEMQNLYKIAKSSKARAYLGAKFNTLKFFLKL